MSATPRPGGLDVRRVLDALLYGLVLTGLVPVLTSGELPPWAWAVVVPALAASVAFRDALARPGVRRMVNAAAVLVLGALIYDAVQTRDWLLDAVWFVLFMSVVKLFQRDTPWDHYQVVALAFLLLLGASILNPSLQFAFGFLLFVVLLAYTLLFLHIRRAEPDRRRLERGVLPWRYFVVTGVLAVVLFLSSFLLFFLFPRLGLGFFVAQVRRTQDVAGFGDRVELGGFGTVRDNETVVMRVQPQPLRRPAGPMRLRGMAFDLYDGHAWQRSPFRRQRLDPDIDGVYHSLDGDARRGCPAERVAVYLEPLDMPVRLIFGPPGIVEVHPPRSKLDFLRRARAALFQDPAGDLHYEAKDVLGLQYEVVSRACPGPLPVTPTYYYQSWVRDVFLGLPKDLDPRIAALAHEVTDGSGPERPPTPLQRAQALEAWLQGSFRYTLDEAHPPENALAHFLFDDRRGHCEYFATAMAVMLRTLRIPTRVINGFYGGRWNEVGQYVQIRQGDAHSWVEVWLDDEGWTTFDPTPPAEMRLRDTAGIWATARQWLDFLRYRWYQWVVEYSLEKQVEVYKKAAGALDLEPNLKGLRKLGTALKTGFASLVGLVVALVVGRRLWRLWKKRRPFGRTAVQRVTAGLVGDWLRVGRRLGILWAPTELLSAYAARLTERLPERRDDVAWLLARFHEALYAERTLGGDEVYESRQRLRRVRASARKKGPDHPAGS